MSKFEFNNQIKKFTLESSFIKNQQRFPISKFGWPLKEACKVILNGAPGWEENATNIINQHYYLRKKMKSLADLYDLDELKKWHINSIFIPWFSNKPLLDNKYYDYDYLHNKTDEIIKKLCKLISSIEKTGFIESKEINKNIIVYPIDIENDCYYVRAGNHRVAVLAALKEKIPCYLDNIAFLKLRDKKVLYRIIWKFHLYKKYRNYPDLNTIDSWPAVKSKIISIEGAISIKNLFCS